MPSFIRKYQRHILMWAISQSILKCTQGQINVECGPKLASRSQSGHPCTKPYTIVPHNSDIFINYNIKVLFIQQTTSCSCCKEVHYLVWDVFVIHFRTSKHQQLIHVLQEEGRASAVKGLVLKKAASRLRKFFTQCCFLSCSLKITSTAFL